MQDGDIDPNNYIKEPLLLLPYANACICSSCSCPNEVHAWLTRNAVSSVKDAAFDNSQLVFTHLLLNGIGVMLPFRQ